MGGEACEYRGLSGIPTWPDSIRTRWTTDNVFQSDHILLLLQQRVRVALDGLSFVQFAGGAMSDRKTYSAQASADATFSERTVDRMVSDVELARNHAIGRNRRIGQLLCMLGLMRAHDVIPPKTRCWVVGAQLQDFNSKAGHEAAHCMPGRLLLQPPGKGKIDPWSLLKDADSRDSMATLFSRVQDLPANFNKADSYAEMHAKPALKSLLATVCQLVIDAPPAAATVLNVTAVKGAYQQWIVQSCVAYRAAINRKIDIAELDDLPPATTADTFEPHLLNTVLPALMERAVRKNPRGQNGPTVWDYSEQTRILGHYLRASEGSVLGDRLVHDAQAEFKP